MIHTDLNHVQRERERGERERDPPLWIPKASSTKTQMLKNKIEEAKNPPSKITGPVLGKKRKKRKKYFLRPKRVPEREVTKIRTLLQSSEGKKKRKEKNILKKKMEMKMRKEKGEEEHSLLLIEIKGREEQ